MDELSGRDRRRKAWPLGTHVGGGAKEGLTGESQAGEKYDSIFLALCSITERGMCYCHPILTPYNGIDALELCRGVLWEER